MANKYLDTSFVDKAIKFAVDAHADTERRGKGFPYVIHVLEAMEIVASMTNDPELLAAAALHDTVEDTDVTVGQIRSEFGDRVARIVAGESDKFTPGIGEEDSWRARKQAAIDRLAKADTDTKTVALGDKLSNMRAIARDYARQGDDLWKLFHAPGGKADHEWHYRGLARSLSELSGTPAFKEFSYYIEQVFGEPELGLVDMDDYEQSGDGFRAVSYNHKDGKTMIKLYEDYISREIVAKEFSVSRAILNFGLKVPAARRLVTDGRRFGIEFDRVNPKKSFARIISEHPDQLEKYTADFAAMAKKLHSTECDTSLFPSVQEYFLQAVGASRTFSDEIRENALDFIRSVPKATTCIHGDFHVGNALINPETGEEYWIDLADFAYGNPYFDLGMFYFVFKCNIPEMIMHLFHFDYATMERVWEVFCREYFPENVTLEDVDRLLAPYAGIYMIALGERDRYYPFMIEYVNKIFKR